MFLIAAASSAPVDVGDVASRATVSAPTIAPPPPPPPPTRSVITNGLSCLAGVPVLGFDLGRLPPLLLGVLPGLWSSIIGEFMLWGLNDALRGRVALLGRWAPSDRADAADVADVADERERTADETSSSSSWSAFSGTCGRPSMTAASSPSGDGRIRAEMFSIMPSSSSSSSSTRGMTRMGAGGVMTDDVCARQTLFTLSLFFRYCHVRT
mmetsp:Transcript_9270/g.22621  ORF Transcript_9270/g.22621 Transcript_9270/m.22621 type:complete len:210 (-) Transcript_9270:227-856(-)